MMQRDALLYLYSRTSWSFLIRFSGIAVMFLGNVLLARALPPAEYGRYAYTIELAALISVLAGLGFNQIAVRVVPDFVREGGATALARFSRAGAWLTLATVVTAAPLLYLAWRLGALPAGYALPMVGLALLLLLTMSLLRLQQEIMRGARRIVQSQILEQLVWPLSLVAIGLLLMTRVVHFAAAGVLVAQIAIFAGCWFFLLRSSRTVLPRTGERHDIAGTAGDVRGWIAIGLPLAVSGGFSVLLKRGDILALGVVASPEQIASYAAAVRVAGLTIFGLAAANATSAPLMREYWKSGDRVSLQGCIDRSAAIATLFSLPLVVAFLAVPEFFLGAFGHNYLRGADALRLLAVGQMINALTGPVGPTMIAAGRQRAYLAATATTAVLMVFMLAVLVPRYQLVGAAASAALSAAVLNLSLAYLSRRQLGLRTYAGASALGTTIREVFGAAWRVVAGARARLRTDA